MFDLVVIFGGDHQQEAHGNQDQQRFVAAADHQAPDQGQKKLNPDGHRRQIGHPLVLSSFFLYKKSFSPSNFFS
jgi:hypothetical protein